MTGTVKFASAPVSREIVLNYVASHSLGQVSLP
jgi:hypothetical protein